MVEIADDILETIHDLERAGYPRTAGRVRDLCRYAEDDPDEPSMRAKSLRNMARLVTVYGTRRPLLGVTPHGLVEAFWTDDARSESLTMDFRENGDVRFCRLYGPGSRALSHTLSGVLPPEKVMEYVGSFVVGRHA